MPFRHPLIDRERLWHVPSPPPCFRDRGRPRHVTPAGRPREARTGGGVWGDCRVPQMAAPRRLDVPRVSPPCRVTCRATAVYCMLNVVPASREPGARREMTSRSRLHRPDAVVWLMAALGRDHARLVSRKQKPRHLLQIADTGNEPLYRHVIHAATAAAAAAAAVSSAGCRQEGTVISTGCVRWRPCRRVTVLSSSSPVTGRSGAVSR